MGMTASDMKFLDSRDDFLETGSQNSVKTNNDVVLLWDMLKVSHKILRDVFLIIWITEG